jgi:hypothetical protein
MLLWQTIYGFSLLHWCWRAAPCGDRGSSPHVGCSGVGNALSADLAVPVAIISGMGEAAH